MRIRPFGLSLVVLAGVTLQPSAARVSADHDHRRDRAFSAALVSFNEVPAVSSEAKGLFLARLNRAGDALSYSLRYSGLSLSVTQAHIHLGQRHTNGGIMVWLCQSATNA
ncbi:MAG TPA: CHRD domain-containing protein, partial [Vicinamibacteria bacterium]